MQSYRYTVRKNGVPAHVWVSDFADENYYEPAFGLKERWVHENSCTEDDKASALNQTIIEDVQATETEPAVTHIEYLLPATYTVEIEDITEEVKQRNLRSFTESKWAETENAIKGLLSPMDFETHLAKALYAHTVALNWRNLFTPEQVDQASATVDYYMGLFGQIEQMRATRDQEIDAYKASLGL